MEQKEKINRLAKAFSEQCIGEGWEGQIVMKRRMMRLMEHSFKAGYKFAKGEKHE